MSDPGGTDPTAPGPVPGPHAGPPGRLAKSLAVTVLVPVAVLLAAPAPGAPPTAGRAGADGRTPSPSGG